MADQQDVADHDVEPMVHPVTPPMTNLPAESQHSAPMDGPRRGRRAQPGAKADWWQARRSPQDVTMRTHADQQAEQIIHQHPLAYLLGLARV
jgi:hypothetical protein